MKLLVDNCVVMECVVVGFVEILGVVFVCCCGMIVGIDFGCGNVEVVKDV